MLNKSQIGLNRIIYPKVGIDEFFAMTAELGLHKVELRNDLSGNDIIDGLSLEKIKELAGKYDIEILTINALQKFNLPVFRKNAIRELKNIIDLAHAIGCRAIVLCPNNDPNDSRNGNQSLRDTIDSLMEFKPLLEDSGLLGNPLWILCLRLPGRSVRWEAIATRLYLTHFTISSVQMKESSLRRISMCL